MKKKRIRLDITFNKQQLLLLKKFGRIHGVCCENNIPYHFLNRCYKRYIKNQKEHNLKYNKDIFQNAIKIYLVAEKEGYKYDLNTRCSDAYKIANMCGSSRCKIC